MELLFNASTLIIIWLTNCISDSMMFGLRFLFTQHVGGSSSNFEAFQRSNEPNQESRFVGDVIKAELILFDALL